MKKIILASALAMVFQAAHADKPVRFYVGSQFDVDSRTESISANNVRINLGDYSDEFSFSGNGTAYIGNAGLLIGADLSLQNHQVNTNAHLSAARVLNIANNEGGVLLRYGLSGTYGYRFKLDNGLSVTPKVGLGYKGLSVGDPNVDALVNAVMGGTFAQIGVSVRKEFDSWAIQPEISYQHGFNKTFGNSRESITVGGERGVRIAAAMERDVSKNFGTRITPFYEYSSRSHRSNIGLTTDSSTHKLGVQYDLRF